MIDELLKYLRETITSHRPYVPTAITEALTEAADTIEILSEKLEANNGWIPCSERLPEQNQNVIACFAHGTVTELRFYDKKFHGIYDYDEKVIVAWQPLPEAYHG